MGLCENCGKQSSFYYDGVCVCDACFMPQCVNCSEHKNQNEFLVQGSNLCQDCILKFEIRCKHIEGFNDCIKCCQRFPFENFVFGSNLCKWCVVCLQKDIES